jgi:hypothetical protein
MGFNKISNYVDIYGFRPRLFIGGYAKYGTVVGVITTVITYLFLTFIFFYYLIQMVTQQNLTAISSTRTSTTDDFIEINKDNFFFAFALEDKNYNLYIDEGIYYPEIHYKRGIRNSKGQFDYSNAIKFELDRCNYSYFGIDYNKSLINYPLNNLYCLNDLNHTIKGSFSDDEYSFITLKIYKCKNNTNRICKDEKNISDHLDGAIFTIQYQDSIFDPNNFSYPFKPIMGDFMTTVSQKYYKDIYIYLKKFSLISDKGIIFENKM